MNDKLSLFEGKEIRKVYKNNKWYYSIIDVISVLTNSSNPSEYLKKIKQRDKYLETNWSLLCININMQTKDGKIRKVISSDTIGVLRIIEAISSSEAEKIKMWLARLGNERIDEINNPELAMDRMKKIYELKGYSKGWIEQREREITTRHSLKDEWEIRGIKQKQDYLILVNEIYKNSFGITTKEYIKLKEINDLGYLKDSMTNLELALTNFAETITADIHKKNNSQGMDELKKDINEVGMIINKTKIDIENKLDKSIVSKENHMNLTD